MWVDSPTSTAGKQEAAADSICISTKVMVCKYPYEVCINVHVSKCVGMHESIVYVYTCPPAGGLQRVLHF